MKCETCIYKNNCQFLAKHKKSKVIGCTAFISEVEFINEAIKEFAAKLLQKECKLTEYDEGGWDSTVFAVKTEEIRKLVKETVGEDDDN